MSEWQQDPKATGGKIRLFAALTLPQSVKDTLTALPHKGLDARWSKADDMHITLRFLGEVDPAQLPDIKAALDRVRRAPFNIELGGLGAFQEGRQPVLWADVQSTRKLTALTAEINAALEPLGFEMPRKPFRPHVTLARLNKPQGLEAFQQKNSSKVRASWQAASFGLYLSAAPDEKGSVYRELQGYRLKP